MCMAEIHRGECRSLTNVQKINVAGVLSIISAPNHRRTAQLVFFLGWTQYHNENGKRMQKRTNTLGPAVCVPILNFPWVSHMLKREHRIRLSLPSGSNKNNKRVKLFRFFSAYRNPLFPQFRRKLWPSLTLNNWGNCSSVSKLNFVKILATSL